MSLADYNKDDFFESMNDFDWELFRKETDEGEEAAAEADYQEFLLWIKTTVTRECMFGIEWSCDDRWQDLLRNLARKEEKETFEIEDKEFQIIDKSGYVENGPTQVVFEVLTGWPRQYIMKSSDPGSWTWGTVSYGKGLESTNEIFRCKAVFRTEYEVIE